MKITKYGHSCLLVEEREARILIDPGIWSEGADELTDLHAIFLSHEHSDHADIEALKKILARNSGINIFTNAAVGARLHEAGLKFQLFVDGNQAAIRGVVVEASGTEHAVIYPTIPVVANTGFFVAHRFFYPGDTVWNMPAKPVEILALPVVATWLRMSDAIDYAKKIKPKAAFPVHDGFLEHIGPFHKLPETLLIAERIRWVAPQAGEAMEF